MRALSLFYVLGVEMRIIVDNIDISLLPFYIQDESYFFCLGRCFFIVYVACCSYYRIFANQTTSSVDYLVVYVDH